MSDFNGNRIFSTDFPKLFKYQILRKSDQLDMNCSMRSDGDITKFAVVFGIFGESALKTFHLCCIGKNIHNSFEKCKKKLIWGEWAKCRIMNVKKKIPWP